MNLGPCPGSGRKGSGKRHRFGSLPEMMAAVPGELWWRLCARHAAFVWREAPPNPKLSTLAHAAGDARTL